MLLYNLDCSSLFLVLKKTWPLQQPYRYIQQEYIQAGQVQRIRKKKTPGIQIKIKWAREDIEVTVGSGEQRSDQEHSQQKHVLSDTAVRLTCVGWQRPV